MESQLLPTATYLRGAPLVFLPGFIFLGSEKSPVSPCDFPLSATVMGIWKLGHLITADTFLRLYTSAENGSRVESLAPGQNKRKESHVWPILPGNPRECT